MDNRRTFIIALFFLMTILACALPGGSAPTEPAPKPSSTPRPTLGPTQTPTATAHTGSTGSSLTAQTDGTMLFVDDVARFQLNVSPGWLPVRINEQEYYDAFSLPVASDAAVQRALMNIKTLDPNTFRLFVYDLQDGHMINGVITGVNFVWDPQGSIPLDGEAGIKEAASKLSASIPNLNVDSYSVSATTTNGIPIGIILSNIPGKTFQGTDVVLFQKQVYLNLPAGTLVVSFTTEQNFKDATLPFFDTMVETIKINP